MNSTENTNNESKSTQPLTNALQGETTESNFARNSVQ